MLQVSPILCLDYGFDSGKHVDLSEIYEGIMKESYSKTVKEAISIRHLWPLDHLSSLLLLKHKKQKSQEEGENCY